MAVGKGAGGGRIGRARAAQSAVMGWVAAEAEAEGAAAVMAAAAAETAARAAMAA